MGRFLRPFFIKKIGRWDLAFILLSLISFSVLFHIFIRAAQYFSFSQKCEALFDLEKKSSSGNKEVFVKY